MLGGIFATVGMVFPSIVIIIIVASVLQQFMEYQIVASALMGIRAVVCALLAHTVITLARKSLVDMVTVILFVVGLVLCFIFDVTPILIVLIGGISGVIIGKIKEVRGK